MTDAVRPVSPVHPPPGPAVERAPRRGVGHFTSARGHARFAAAYEEAMLAMPDPSAEHDVETDFGRVHVYRFGLEQGSPIVLLHGRHGTTAMWEPNVAALTEGHSVYSVELLGEPGRSVQTAPLRGPDDHARWLDAVLAILELEPAHLVGASIGGWLALNQALHSPARVASVSLLDPVNTLARFPPRVALAALAALPFAPRSARRRFLSWISGDAPVPEDDPVARVISVGMDEYRPAEPGPAYPADDDLRSISVPVLALVGGRSVIHDPSKAVARAMSLLPDVEAELWPAASHAISGECADQVNARVLRFVGRVDRVDRARRVP